MDPQQLLNESVAFLRKIAIARYLLILHGPLHILQLATHDTRVIEWDLQGNLWWLRK
jgi:hypothetical protein